MRRGFQGVVLSQYARLFESGTLSAASDRELLDEFTLRRDDAAFEVLLARYGRLVLNVGRKLLHDPRDVEDAFQATFLVLVRKPPRLRVGESLGPWMSTVAYRVAARARANRIRLNRIESTDGLEQATSIDPVPESNALALHEELNRLPERLRSPVVFCYLEGLTRERAAERLGCPVGTVRSRLARARSLLHRRLVGRGVAPMLVPLEVLSSNLVDPPLRLIHQTVRLAIAAYPYSPEAGVASASLLSLVNGVVRMMNLKQALVGLALALPVGGVAVVGAAQAYQQGAKPEKRDGESANAPDDQTIEMTYYVGNLYAFRDYKVEVGGTFPLSEATIVDGRRPDLGPLVAMIESCIAPGTWSSPDVGPRNDRIGRVRLYTASGSMVVRHTAEVQAQVSALLSHIRTIVKASVWNAIDQVAPATSKAPIHVRIPSPVLADDQRKAEAPKQSNESPVTRRDRVRQLLKQLQSELEAIEWEAASNPAPK